MKDTRVQLLCVQPEFGVVEAKESSWPNKEYEDSLYLDSGTQGLTWLPISGNTLAPAL